MTRTAFALLIASSAALSCSGGDGPLSGGRVTSHPVRFSLTSRMLAAQGAVIEADVSYVRPSGASVTIARDSVSIGASGTQIALPVAADVSGCLSDAASAGSSCAVTFALRMKRDGRLLDESSQRIPITESTQLVIIPDVTLYEVSTVNIVPATLVGLESGESRTLVATAIDRSGLVLTGRTTAWQVVSGNVTLSSDGLLRAIGVGAARVRASVGGRERDLTFTIGPVTVATLQIAPLDTIVAIGGRATYRVVARTATGDLLPGRTVTYTSANVAVATIAGDVATAVGNGQTTITARSSEGRDGAIVTSSTTLRVEAGPPLLVDRATVTLDSLEPGATGLPATVAVTTSAGRRIGELRASVTYAPNVTPWLTATLNPLATPSTLAVRASSGGLSAGNYAADVLLTSATDPHQPVTVRVLLRVATGGQVVLNPRVVSLGTYAASQSSAAPVLVSVTSSTRAVVAGLSSQIEYLGARSGWLAAFLQATSAPPATTLILTPNPFGLPIGTHQARVIVRSTTLGAGADTTVATLTISNTSLGRFGGLVLSEANSVPLSNARVTVRRSDSSVADVINTGVDGRFTSNTLPSGTYAVSFEAQGFVATTLVNQILTVGGSTQITTLQTVRMVSSGSGFSSIFGAVRDATTNAAVAGATIELRQGGNNTTGNPVATTTSNAGGSYSFQSQPAGTYTVLAVRQGYTPSAVTVTAFGTSSSAPLIFLSSGSGNIAWRFVLSWGASPSDLDANLTGPIPNSQSRFHVYFSTRGSSSASPFTVLDVDQVDGLGPETITMVQQFAGVYRYYVNNFSLETALSTSNARVDVYRGSTFVNRFFVPAGSGTYWTVLELDGNTLTPINTLGTVAPPIRSPLSRSTGATGNEWYDLQPWQWSKSAPPRRR